MIKYFFRSFNCVKDGCGWAEMWNNEVYTMRCDESSMKKEINTWGSHHI